MRPIVPLASRLAGRALVALGLGLLTAGPATAGTFTSDFASGIPLGINLYGSAAGYDHTTGGRTGGALKLTTTASSQQSSAILDDLDAGATVAGFDATFNIYIGSGSGADGMSFVFGDFYDNSWGEEGPGTMRGLTVVFDEYNNGGTPGEAPAIDVKWNNVPLFHRLVGATSTTSPAAPIGSATTIRTQTTSGGAAVWWPVKIHVDPDGTLDLVYNNVVIFTNLPVFRPFFTELGDTPIYSFAGYRFGFGARTGGSADNHWIDDLSITTYPAAANSGQPSLISVSQQPVGANAGAAGGAVVVFTNSTFSVDPAKVTMKYNNNTVTPAVSQVDGLTTVSYYGVNGVLPAGAGTVAVSYATTSTPQFTNTFSYNFVVDPFTTVASNTVVANVDTSKPGFKIRVFQNDVRRGPGNNTAQLIQAERQLALGYIDPATGQPYPNTIDTTLAEPDLTFVEPGVINYNIAAPANAGGFNAGSNPPKQDNLFPGIPGLTTIVPVNENFALEATAFIYLKAGGHRFGVNSDDGFRVSIGTGFDAASSQILGSFGGSRGTADTLFDLVVPADGYYPVRLTYCQGGGGGSCEFFYFDQATGQKILVNDPDNLAAPRAYRESPVANPSITRVLPVQNWIGAFPDEDVVVEITDSAYVVSSAVSLSINNVEQAITASKSGKVTTIKRPGSLSNLLPSGLNTVQVTYSFDKAGTPVTATNIYQFSVAPYYGVLPAGNRVTSVADPGFRAKVAQMDRSGDANQGNGSRINGGSDSNRMPWPEVQLADGMINPTNGLPYPNLAQPGANNFLYDFDVVNWQFNSASADTAQSGWFRDVSPFAPMLGARADIGVPGFPGTGTSYGGLENAVMEITTHLELKRGSYVFGFNSDDGFIAISGPEAHDTLGTLLGFDNRGKGNSDTLVAPTGQNPPVISPYVSSGSTLFSVIVPQDGVYPFRILYWQGGTGFNAEFFSINKTNGAFLLVGDSANGGIPAFRTYNGPARPYVKFSVCPTPWDGAVQQAGPGPIKMVGRTRNAVNSSDIYNYVNTGIGIVPRPWADTAIGGVVANGTSEANLRLLLNGVEVPATKTTNGTDVTVAFRPDPPLPSGSTNTASLVYADTTNSWTWVTETWTALNASDALPAASANPNARGFKVKIHKLAAAPANGNTVATAERQLAGELGANQLAAGPEADGSYIYPNIINWNNNVHNTTSPGAQLGNFQASTGYGAGTGWPFPFYADERIPGIVGTGNTDYLAAEVFAYLEFPTAGYYRLAANSDDAFGLKVGTPGVTNGLVIRAYNTGKGASDLTASFLVPQAGLYPIRLVYYNGTGGAELEYFSYDINGTKIPINDTNNAAAIKAYYALASVDAPVITGSKVTGGSITITWINGGTLESAPEVSGPWTSTGDSDGSFTEAATGPAKYYRVKR